jgi:hypothetical protein
MGLPEGTHPGLELAHYIEDEGLRSLIQEFSQGCHIGTDDSPTYEFNFNQDRFLFARGRPVMDDTILGDIPKREAVDAILKEIQDSIPQVSEDELKDTSKRKVPQPEKGLE